MPCSLNLLGVHAHGMRIAGYYNPRELKSTLEVLKPENLVSFIRLANPALKLVNKQDRVTFRRQPA